MRQLKIGILGEIRSGKDTVSQLLSYHLSEMSNKSTCFLAFSKGIHDVIELTMPEVYDIGKPRKELQDIGQFMRQLKPDVWIEYLFKTGEYLKADCLNHHLIITDVRQPNEVARLQEDGYIILKVTATQEVRLQRAKDKGDSFSPEMFNHETELVIHSCPYDYLIDNSFSIDVLQDRVKEILREVADNEQK